MTQKKDEKFETESIDDSASGPLPSVSFYLFESEDVTQLANEYGGYKSHIEQFVDLTKLEALMSWKMPLFENQI